MAHRPCFVLDPEQRLVGVDIDDVQEPVLVLIAFFGDQPTIQQLLMRAGEIGQRDLDMVAVVFRVFKRRLAIDDAALAGAGGPCVGAALIGGNTGDAAKDFLIETSNRLQIRAHRDVEFDIGHADAHRSEQRGRRGVDTNAVAPGAGRFHDVARFAKAELRAFEEFLCVMQAFQQRLQVGHDQSRGVGQYPNRGVTECPPADRLRLLPIALNVRSAARFAALGQ